MPPFISVATPFHLLDPVIETLTGGAYTPIAIPICENAVKVFVESIMFRTKGPTTIKSFWS